MASTQEPEVQLAQRLASNEKPVRTKAMKKLRKYINVRSHNATSGFSSDELLKLWKGLFYCLWMQDKPLLQEELSDQISTLIHSFHDTDGQLLYLESFLLTLKREWTGIDRLRMDKFFQLVRFMFRQTFEMLKKKQWEHSVVGRFLELLNTQLLQSSSAAPSGLQLHVLDLYMTELAAVGSAELTAEQNLTFIEPFCKTAARTKDQTLFRAICSGVLSTIIDQAPFAIEDLMKELKADQSSDCDSGQASEEDGEEEQKETRSKAAGKKRKGKQINGITPHEEEEDDSDDADLLNLEDSGSEVSCDEDVGPVLQFDYVALADKLLELASRSSTPSRNRQRLYKIIKILRDLSEGIFPQDEYPEEVSTDEDDDMFGSRKRIKTGGRPMEEEGEPPAAKKRKKKDASTPNKQSKQSMKDANEPADLTASNENKKKKKKRKKRKTEAAQDRSKDGEENTGGSEQTVAEAQRGNKETEGPECSHTEHLEKEAQAQSCLPSVKVTEAAPPEGHTGTLLLSAVTEESTSDKDQSEERAEAAEEQQTAGSTEPVMSPEVDTTVCGKKKKKKTKKKDLKEISETVAEVQVDAQEDIIPVNCEEPAEKNAVVTPQTDATTPAKKKMKNPKQSESQGDGVSAEAECPSKCCDDSEEGGATNRLEEPADSTTPCSKKSKKKNLKAEAEAQITVDTETKSAGEETSKDASTVPLQKKKRASRGLKSSALPAAAEEEGLAVETPQSVDAEVTMTTPSKKKKKKLAGAELPLGQAEVVSETPARKKKRKIPVEFEYEVDELEAAAAEATPINRLDNEETVAKKSKPGSDFGEPSTPLRNKKSQKKAKASSGSPAEFVTFQSKAPVPAPLFCKTKGSPSTPLSSKKKSRTPKSESKKVTFGLKNNKTAEFRKTDRSLLVSPDGSSRVPFDPKQKPKFGVLKSPSTPACSRKTSRKSSCSAPNSTPKRRPSAADFF